jgi:5'-nucleotidase
MKGKACLEKFMKLPDHILLTNDDGIDAPGIRALQRLIGPRAILVAPSSVRSGCSHYVTMDHPIRVEERSEREFAVDGTPGDCVRLALKHFAPQVELVLSGINDGGNLGHDIYLSGTVAAAREAAFHGIPAVALSQYFRPEHNIDWAHTQGMAEEALRQVLALDAPPRTFWNINLPCLPQESPRPDVVFCEYSRDPLPTQYENGHNGYLYVRSLYHSRPRHPGTDVDVCFGGRISATQLCL